MAYVSIRERNALANFYNNFVLTFPVVPVGVLPGHATLGMLCPVINIFFGGAFNQITSNLVCRYLGIPVPMGNDTDGFMFDILHCGDILDTIFNITGFSSNGGITANQIRIIFVNTYGDPLPPPPPDADQDDNPPDADQDDIPEAEQGVKRRKSIRKSIRKKRIMRLSRT